MPKQAAPPTPKKATPSPKGKFINGRWYVGASKTSHAPVEAQLA